MKVQWGGETYDIEGSICQICGKEFEIEKQLRGHMVGAHISNKAKLRGRDHPNWDERIDHGTNAGYQKEIRRGIKTCAPCREARRIYNRRKRDDQTLRKSGVDEDIIRPPAEGIKVDWERYLDESADISEVLGGEGE